MRRDTLSRRRLSLEDADPRLIINEWVIIMIIMIFNQMIALIASCRYQSDVDKQIQMLHAINSALPNSLRLQMPSLLTNDYVSRALDIIEDRVASPVDM
jgi:hypothetical protein